MADSSYTYPLVKLKPFSKARYDSASFNTATFAKARKREIEDEIAEKGFHLQLARPAHIAAIKQLIADECNEQVSQQMAESDLYRCVVFGYFVLIKKGEQIVSFQITMPYADSERTAYGIFSLAKKEYEGLKLPVLASRYASLMAMEQGQLVKRTWIAPGNYSSLKNGMNYCGYFCEGFSRELYMPDQPRILFLQYLTPEGIFNNLVENGEVDRFLAENQDRYQLIDPLDFDRLEHVLQEDEYTICALAHNDEGEPCLVAVSNHLIKPV